MQPSATVHAAELFRMSGLVGTIQTIAYADMLVYDRNPVEDLQVVMHPQEHLRFISRAGVIAKNTLT